ncbi:23S rRNA (guanosine(2251)-2'-O)-methyltransferase RlmB [Clostridium amazonitimonense]|uniref:23S rRNA (guanosine(2251)-2'-O)-methyltransferase RlmB n=1 Tax=Clostridium amazonitimonense TaxID=1499689 RepID=UPI000509EA8B|nr:23S rRNA (guanosine(2251)-2'-O)-methyltransferase RlmB [Clostridium amazonitimonense]
MKEKKSYIKEKKAPRKESKVYSDNKNKDSKEREDLIEGRNAVIEVLKSERTIEQLWVAKGEREGSINSILSLAKEKSIVIKEVDRQKLNSISQTGNHQGVIALITPYNYYSVEDILKNAEEKGEDPFIVILDEIEDPHNLGSIIRTAELCGAHGIIIPKRRNVGVTATVYKTSAGAAEHMKVAKVTNINSTIEKLKEKGIWIYGADMEGDQYSHNVDFKGAVALVIGSEGKGISKLTREKCDVIVSIPMAGKLNSLNASVAAGILMYEVLKSRFEE